MTRETVKCVGRAESKFSAARDRIGGFRKCSQDICQIICAEHVLFVEHSSFVRWKKDRHIKKKTGHRSRVIDCLQRVRSTIDPRKMIKTRSKPGEAPHKHGRAIVCHDEVANAFPIQIEDALLHAGREIKYVQLAPWTRVQVVNHIGSTGSEPVRAPRWV